MSSDLKDKVLRFLISNNSPVSERQMADILGVTHTAINKVMKGLAKYNIISSTKVGSAQVWRINDKSAAYQLVRKYVGLQCITGEDLVREKIIEFLDIFSSIYEGIHRNRPRIDAYIFGSVADKTAKPDSDIDLLILTDEKTKKGVPPSDSGIFTMLSARVVDSLGNSLAIHLYSYEEVKTRPELHWVKDAIKKGIKVYPDD